jgi:putative ABC transport system permease protein
VRSGLRIAMVESLVVGGLGTLIGIVAGIGVVSWTMNDLLGDTLPDLGAVVTLAPASIVIAVTVGIGAVALAPLLMVRRLRRMDIPSTLRVVE